MKIALVAPSRYPIREPYAGGLEAFCDTLRHALLAAGHEVDLYATAGSDGHVREVEFPGVDWTGYEHLATDHTYPPGERERETAAFARLRAHLESCDYDVVHNNSLHPGLIGADLPLLTTLHTPAFWEVQDAITAAGSRAGSFAAVSAVTAASWQLPHPATVVPNAVDSSVFHPRDLHREGAIWFGRITYDKGLHVAIDAARAAGLPLTIAGRAADAEYWDDYIEERMGPDLRFVGEQRRAHLAEYIAAAKVALITPLWEEPFGLTTIEAAACGTPVAALDRGGPAEILRTVPAAGCADNDLAVAIDTALQRAHPQQAAEYYSTANLVARYEELYRLQARR